MAKIVVALGGNALGNSPEEQLRLVKHTAKSLVALIKKGHEIVVSHGNGPQVGAINLGMNFAAESGQGTNFPFPECGAMSQGYIGYHLQQSLLNELRQEGINKEVATIITQIEVVDESDQAFSAPTKPIGTFYDKETSEKIAIEKGYTFVEDAGRGYRRVVASPEPKKIIEINSIKTLIENDTLVIAGGGGGIPVINKGGYEGIAAVIDKDKSSALLAGELAADQLIILTAVDYVYTQFGKENQKALTEVNENQMIDYVNQGEFAKGSMLPKVIACMSFLDHNPKGTALITSLNGLEDALDGKLGTRITK
ncbi:Carbamate kinase [Streptococcus agalactiae]|nr:Carbamate kinase [Streptococcus agalactiae]EJZ02602.1 putative amino acid kinase [Streptococcus agalactiae STIR-CD-17]EPU04183.1 carbamate kinase [Streptococcus agalactiae STIR-CD-09]EPU06070.1 carbamate kinase [Streptococcus agalactiae STIR-CD-13]EPW84321.1 carbamate kinase [Streptococcus agalactiae STIR-CD-07]CCQ76378.1 carbamate kinase [Streptococcus agalactiae SS1219]CCQ79532.1 carbamate kinase [Streptococcus agalactiae LADL-90-503]